MNTERISINDVTQENITPIIDELILRSYIYNRQRSPDIPVERWAKVFGQDTYLYELEMQRRLKK
jgi:hypothetical protein